MHESLRPFPRLLAVFSRFYILYKGVAKSGLSRSISLVVFLVLFYGFQTSAQTWLPTGGGDWTVGANWSGGLAPVPGASVVINSDQSGNITNIPTINLTNLTISGSCVFAAATNGNTVIVTGNFTVAAGKTFTIGASGARMNFTLNASAVGTISGTAILDAFVGGVDRFFINNGDLTIPVGGLLSGLGESIFTTTSGSTLRIGSPAGITLSGATGSIQTTGSPSSRIYDTGANYVYIGNANQGVGNGLPATVASLTIANTGGGGNNTVALASNISITNDLTVNSGVFTLGANNVTGVGSVSMTGTSITGTGTLTLGGNVSTSSSGVTATISAPIALNATRSFTVANGAANPDLTISSVISTIGGLTKNGAGSLLLSASNTFTGGVSIDAGTLRLGNTGALNSGIPNAVSFGAASTGILQLNGNSVTVSDINTNIAVGTPVIENGVAGTSTLTINTSGSSTYAGTIQNGGAGITAISKSGTGSLTLSGGNTYSGTTTLSAGTVNINSITAIGTGTFTLTGGAIDNTSGGGITLSTNNVQNWNGDFAFTGTQNLNLGTGAVTLSADRLITANANNLTVGGIISGGFRLTKDGAGALTLTGANIFSGGTTLNAGTLNINNSNALGTAAGTLTINGGTIDNTTGGSITTLNYPQTWAGDFSFTGTQNLNLGTGNVTLSTNCQVTINTNTLTVGGTISAPGLNLTKAGAGTLSFGSSAITINSLAINAGTLTSTSGILTISGNFTSSGTFNHNNGTVTFNGGSSQSVADVVYNHLNFSGAGQKNASGNVSVVGNLTNTSVFDLSTNTLSVSGTIANTGGTVRFSGLSNGMAINTGTVEYYGAGQDITAGIYQNLTISQSSGEASLGGAVTVNGVLTLNTGRLNLSGFNLTLGPSATISVASPSASKMIIATGGSEVIKSFASTGLFDFPIGDNTGSTEYSPVSVNITSGTGFPADVRVSVTDAKHANNASSVNFISRYWNVTQTGITNCIATISGVYLDSDINGAEASIKGAELTGTFNQVSNPWIKYAIVTAASNTITCTGAVPNLTSGLTSFFTGITLADPTVTITGGGVSICNGQSVALGTNVSGADGSVLYSWSPAAGLSATTVPNPTASPASTTPYTVTITDANGITDTDVTTITVDAIPTLVITNPPAVCAPATVDLTAPAITSGSTGGLTLTYWTDAGATSSYPTPGAATTGTYYIKGTTGANCSAIQPVVAVVNPQPTADAGPASVTICDGQTTVLGGSPSATGGSGSYTYSWSPATGLSSTSVSNPTFSSSGAVSQLYTLTVTDGNGCQHSNGITVNVTALPSAPSVTFTPSTFCQGATITPPTTSGTALQWWNNAGLTVPIATADPANPTLAELGFSSASSGTTTVYVTQTVATCRSLATPVTLTINPGFTPALVSSDGDNTICQGTSVTYTATPIGSTNYNFILNGNFGSPVQTGASNVYTTATLANGDQLQVVVTNAGCTYSSNTITTTVNANPIPTLSSSDGDNTICS
ncbi:MAG: autotransporter-associated beta strand repeat-containing protein, partial [Cyclobacteriaceae bacterium]